MTPLYIVLTGDLKSSKKIENRSIVQENLKTALNYINYEFSDYIATEFKIIGGDGFQGMISSPIIIFDLYFTLFEKIDHPFYLGIGIGEIYTRLSENIEEIDGKAFHFSSNALEIAKRKKRWIVLESSLVYNDLFESVLNLSFEIMWDWTKRRKEIIIFYRKHQENSTAIEEASIKFKVKTRTIYHTLESGKYSLLKYAENTFKKAINEDWSKL